MKQTREYFQTYRQAHRERLLEHYTRYREANRDTIREKQRVYNEAHRDQAQAYREAHREHYQASARRSRYGLAGEAAWERGKLTGCDDCGAMESAGGRALHIDHDHETGEVRGIVCHACNVRRG